MKMTVIIGIALAVLLVTMVSSCVNIYPPETSPSTPTPTPSPAPSTTLPPTSTDSSKRVVTDCVEPANSMVRDTAVAIIADVPSGLNPNAQSWKIWKINYWVAENINYISDPKSSEYIAYAHETLQIRGGDCDDFAVLLASLYEAVGLDVAIAEVDTNADKKIDHMACLVFWPRDSQSFLDDENTILEALRLSSPTGQVYIRFIEAAKATSSVLNKYSSGVWIIADPPMAEVKNMVGYITQEDYSTYETIDVGL